MATSVSRSDGHEPVPEGPDVEVGVAGDPDMYLHESASKELRYDPSEVWWLSAGSEAAPAAGPMSWTRVQAQLREGGDVNVWRQGMADWMDLHRVQVEGWFYLDDEGVALGPFLLQQVSALVQEGEVDGLSMFWREGMADWTPAAEIDVLKEQIQREEAPEEEGEEAAERTPLGSDTEAETAIPPAVPEGEQGAEGTAPRGPDDKHRNGQAEEEGAKDAGLERLKAEEERRLQRKRKKDREKLKKLMRSNSSVYFRGIPPDTTEEEVAELFSIKGGIIKPDPDTGKPKIKLYRDDNNELKGDGIVTFLLQPSVDNAILLLDGVDFRDGFKLEVHKAEFKIKGDTYIPPPKRSKGSNNAQQQLLDKKLTWNEGVDDGRGLRIVILKGCFDPRQIHNSSDYEELQNDIELECWKMGEVEKVTVFQLNPDGVVAVKFKIPSSAERCIEVMNGRWFDGRRLEADFFDGKSDYRITETDEQRERRMKEWAEWLQRGGD